MKNSWIKVRSFGGDNTVPGSCRMVTATVDGYDYNYFVDCGLFQGHRAKKHPEINFNIRDFVYDINGIFITHAHIDHIGRVPAMFRWGYTGPVYATEAVCGELAGIMLGDSANIQLEEYLANSEREMTKKIKGDPYREVELLYDPEDAKGVLDQFVAVKRYEEIKINEHLTVVFYDAGHVFGSASIKMIFNNGEETYALLFSGDLGNENNPILKEVNNPYITGVDAVFCETTYAGRFHGSRVENYNEVRQKVAETLVNGGKAIFPSFAYGRTQELLYMFFIDMLHGSDWISELFRNTDFEVDSPMAIEVTKIFARFPDEFKEDVKAHMQVKGNGPFDFSNLHFVYDKDASIALCADTKPRIIFSSSGMCEGGRVVFHLRENLESEKNLIVFTGYQEEGTLGRKLLDGEKHVTVANKYCEVKAQMISLNTISGHADQNGIIKWLSNIEPGYMLFLVHGEEERQVEFKKLLESFNLFSCVEAVKPSTVYELNDGTFEKFELVQEEAKKKPKKMRRKDIKCLVCLNSQLAQLENEEGCEKVARQIKKEINEVKASSKKKHFKEDERRFKKGYKE